MSATPGDRMPPLTDGEMSEAQRTALERILQGPRGRIVGPFVPLLRSPELMTRLQLVGEYIRFDSLLDDDLVELVILIVARHWDQQFEWGFHHPIALQKGVPAEVVEALAESRRPSSARPEALAVWEVVTELLTARQTSDATYEGVVRALGEQRVIEVIGTVGYYTTLAMTMNFARTSPPDGAPRLSGGSETPA